MLVLDLTKYELGNIVWKEHKLGRVKNWEKLMEQWSKIIEELPTYSIGMECLKEVKKIAVERDLSFYDASHIYVAEKLKLITKDEEILNKMQEFDSFRKVSKNQVLKTRLSI